MDIKEFASKVRYLNIILIMLLGTLLVLSGGLLYMVSNPDFSNYENENYVDIGTVENGIHVATGFIYDDGVETVISSCTPCHSAQLVTQNRASKAGWEGIIRWMQDTQNLWDLGDNESVILDYLSKNYAPEEKGRRENLGNVEWYDLKE